MPPDATVSMLYDTLDSLVALKLDLEIAERHDAAAGRDRRRQMSSDIDHSIENLRSVLARLEERSGHAAGASEASAD